MDQTGWEHRDPAELEPTPLAPGDPATISTTVTYLEMLEPPSRPTVPAPSKPRTSLVRLENPTVNFYRYLYDTVGGPWTWIERRLMDDDALHAAISDEDVEIYVLWAGGAPAGYGEINRGVRANQAELTYFGLIPDFIGHGLGWYFINAMVDIAWMAEPERVWVHTCDLDHPRALGNYQRAGFQVFGQGFETLPDPRAAGLPLPPPHAERQRGTRPVGDALRDDTVVPLIR